MQIIAICTQKGGAGKTTSAVITIQIAESVNDRKVLFSGN